MSTDDSTVSAFSYLTPAGDIGAHCGGHGNTFILRPPYQQEEAEKVGEKIDLVMKEATCFLSENGVEAFRNKYNCCNNNQSLQEQNSDNDHDKLKDEERLAAEIKGCPRQYQLDLFEQCKKANTIVHLGTGQGKTFIALLCMRYYLVTMMNKNADVIPNVDDGIVSSMADRLPLRRPQGNQIWFLVPSVALAIQHTITIRTNLGPTISVGTACHITSTSAKSRNALAQVDLIVTTHGSAKDLLDHYGECFNLKRVSLLVIDECHYCGAGNHPYAQIMETYYHSLPVEQRPRVVGLTASPLISIKKNTTAAKLQSLILDLEKLMDAKLVNCLKLGKSATESLKNHCSDIAEILIQFNSSNTVFQTLPTYKDFLHKSRMKELQQLNQLYEDLGPRVTGIYCESLVKEISRSRFEGESEEQFHNMRSNLTLFCDFCAMQSSNDNYSQGHTEKMIVLERLLNEFLKQEDELACPEGVGIIFVERRITAIAIHAYFQSLKQNNYDSYIRSDCLVRQPQQLFKYLSISHKVGDESMAADVIKKAEEDWLHQTRKIRAVLDRLRRKDINLLVATSVVEEGVDVAACSFVIVFDNIKTIKSYIQMKGRARQKKAKMCILVDVNPKIEIKPPVSLHQAQTIEKTVHLFLSQREEGVEHRQDEPPTHKHFDPPSDVELQALKSGEYKTKIARVDLRSSKSLLNRYFLSIPIDRQSRSSRETFKAYMPIFEEGKLILPSHFPPKIRLCILPTAYLSCNKTKKTQLLALMAIVRLHRSKLITDRLLPLNSDYMREKILPEILPPLPSSQTLKEEQEKVSFVGGRPINAYLYPLSQSGKVFDEHRLLLACNGRHLGVLATERLPSFKSLTFYHKEFGEVFVNVRNPNSILVCSEIEWRLCSEFYSTLFNARWRHRNGRRYFAYDARCSAPIPPYVVVSLAKNGEIDWVRMKTVISEYNRDQTARVEAAKAFRAVPRLWSPVYAPNITYIALSQTSLTCKASFPDKKFATFCEYFQHCRSFPVDPECPLVSAQALWTLPKGITSSSSEESNNKKIKCQDKVLLPLDACMEAPMPDAGIFLDCTLLPQILYQIDRQITAERFVSHCKERFKYLGIYLEKLDISNIIEVLSARSGAINGVSYDRLEWLGDAVLKLIQTDTLLRSPKLRKWISYLHEGELSLLRSAMGCNKRLADVAIRFAFDKFILTVPLSKSIWVGNQLQSRIIYDGDMITDEIDESRLTNPPPKVCADVVEAILGLIYTAEGFEAAREVAQDLLITVPQNQVPWQNMNTDLSGDEQRLSAAAAFIGRSQFDDKSLLKEALTHGSYMHDVPSYQKLEWLGDAVLCLAAREWVFKTFTDMPVGDLVVFETTLICNETLAYLAWRQGLQDIIYHADSSLPSRIEQFALDSSELGLWASNPPKILGDVCEALLGASYIDAGFDASQRCSNHILSPFLGALKSRGARKGTPLLANENTMMHPKQLLFESTNVLQVVVKSEAEFASNYMKPAPVLIWQNRAWRQPMVDGDGSIAYISCCGVVLVAVCSVHSSSAQNRACALVCSHLQKNPNFLKQIQNLTIKLSES